MAFQFLPFPNDVVLAKTAAADWLKQLRLHATKAPNRPYNVALSGGRIAHSFFVEIVKQLAASPVDLQNAFKQVHFFWADERCVPPDDPESNYSVARQLLFEPLKVPQGQIHRLRGEGPEPLALREAVDDIVSAVPVSSGQPVLDMIFLGTGEDGHVASLFPGESEAVMADPAIYRVVTAVKLPPRRFTLGYGAIVAAANVWVLVSGAGKKESLAESISPGGRTPLARVLRQRAQTVIYSDLEPAGR
ncbi:MAG: 6-phosphogluconolactonase [Pedosphaera sp.]|nr:6-phosphogluconolactonase [Pedosphaera sp.]